MLLFFGATAVPLVMWILSVHLLSRREDFLRFFLINLMIFTAYSLFLCFAGSFFFDYGGYGIGFFLWQYVFMLMHVLIVFAIALHGIWKERFLI